MIAMDSFTKLAEAYAIPNQKSLTVVEALVSNLVPRELHSYEGRNLQSHLM
jgi:hypothetical protein